MADNSNSHIDTEQIRTSSYSEMEQLNELIDDSLSDSEIVLFARVQVAAETNKRKVNNKKNR